MIVKICGLVRPDDAAAAVRAGADWLGLNFWPRSKRYLGPEAAPAVAVAAAARAARPDVVLVGVFVDQEPDVVAELIDRVGLDRVQLHGDEPPQVIARFGERAIKGVGLRGEPDVAALAAYRCPVVLVDTPSAGRGGSGVVGDWALARRVAEARAVLLAGGLTPDNVAQAIAAVRPFGVDVASGVESAPGVKDPRAMEQFVAAARAAADRLAPPPPAGRAM